MSKNFIRLCAFMLSGILCLSSGVQGKAAKVYKEDSDNEVLTVQPYMITTGSAISVYNNSYEIQAAKEEKSNIVFPVVATNGGLVVYDMELLGTVVTKGSISVAIYEDAECKKLLNKKKSYKMGLKKDEIISDSFYLEKGQKCYFQIVVSDELTIEEEWYRFFIRFQEYNSENRILQNKEAVYSYQNGKGTSIYYKLNVSKTGIFTIDMNYDDFSYGSPKITLCNNKKKAISANCGIYITNSAKVKKKKETPKSKNIFAVSKGTYYIKVTDLKGTYKIQSKFTAITDNSGKTKKKAKNLKIGGETLKGVIFTSDKIKDYDWYKFTLEESDRIRISFTGSTSGKEKLQLEVIPPSSAKFSGKAVLKFSGIDKNGSGKSGTQWPAGTYYLRINKTTAKGNGIYQLQVKS
ncbi:MAG: hypothetical protein HFJ09_03785 [Lachnospiraceae bacterium]|nr:hypothetical protein [Lachnospiraceae bacterium]